MNQESVGKSRKSRRRTKTAHNSKMGLDFFKYLPSEIILNIFLRLPAPTLMSCKCVCKPWLDFLTTSEFVKSHSSISVPGLVISMREYPLAFEILYNFFEFEAEHNPRQRCHRMNKVFKFKLPFWVQLYSSVNGLFFSCTRRTGWCFPQRRGRLFIFNPITREHIKLPRAPEPTSSQPQLEKETFGFGLSRITGQYKLVRINHNKIIAETAVSVECQVYTVGTGSWRRISSVGRFKYDAKGVFVNGNLYWLVHEFESSSVRISCFDLETELFSTVSPPCVDDQKQDLSMSSLKDCLCWCDNSAPHQMVIWLMKEYKDEKSWAKEFVIWKEFPICEGLIKPINVFKSGDILMVSITYNFPFYFSKKTENICLGYPAMDDFPIRAVKKNGTIWIDSPSCVKFPTFVSTYTPSFLRLKSFASETVTTF